jgi:predicted Zn finger-like uncharacterized protein
MTMFTRCTACGATFRVTLEHLQASAGQVRCGVCQTAFDAFVSLSANDPRSASPVDGGPLQAPATASVQDEGVPAPQRPGGEPAAGSAPQPEEPEMAPVASVPGTAAAPGGPPRPSALAEPVTHELLARLPAQPPGRPSDPAAVPGAEAQPRPGSSLDAPARRRRSGAWAFVALLLCVSAGLQGAYFLRAELAARVPALRPWLEQACAPLGCDVPLPRATDQLSIEGSDLEALDPARPGRVLLTATIRNRAPFLQAWPMLELTLTNARDQVGIRRIFSAAEYLAPAAPGPGIGPGAEATVKMRLDARELQPAGYRLYLFHP